MDRNLSRLIWEGFLKEWPGPAIMPWSKARIPPAQRVPACLSWCHVPPQSPSQASMCSSHNYALLSCLLPGRLHRVQAKGNKVQRRR